MHARRLLLPFTLCASIFGLQAQTPLLTEDFNGAVGTLPVGWSVFSENAAVLVPRNDGASEFEHRLIADNTVDLRAASYYADTVVTDNGSWRDTTVETLLRYSGGANNQNGLIARARDVTATGGDYYHARLNGDLIQVFRFNNGVTTLVGSTPTPSLGTIIDRLFRLRTQNIANAGTDQVRITVELYNGANLASGVMQSLSVTDTSANALTRAGGAGVRSFHPIAANSGQRATFDNFRVTSDHPNLLWYDDHADNRAIRTESFTAGGATSAVVNQRREFFVGAGDAGLSLVDFDSRTSQSDWADVVAGATLRLNTNTGGSGAMAGGLVLRETGANSASGSGDYYAYRLTRDENTGNHLADLVRVNAGSETLLGQTSLADADIAESVNLFLRFQTYNVAGGVALSAAFSQDPAFGTLLGALNLVDTDAARLTGPGSAGVFTQGLSGLVGAAINFDNFSVTVAVPEPSTGLLLLLGVGLFRRALRAEMPAVRR